MLARTHGASGQKLIRRSLEALCGMGVLATAFELASERHWNSTIQLVPWAALAALLIALAIQVGSSGDKRQLIRFVCLVVIATSLFGIFEHIDSNMEAGVLDGVHGASWDTEPFLSKLWLAVTKTVGPAPTLAPGVLAQTSLILLLATFAIKEPSPR